MARNFYVVLGIPTDATPEQIKAAYRQRAKERHPDLAGSGSGGAPFRELREAYDVLSDPARRRAYDDAQRDRVAVAPRRRSRARGEFFREGPFTRRREHFFAEDFFDPFEWLVRNMLDKFPMPPSGSGWSHGPREDDAPVIDVSLTRTEARHGGKVRLVLPVETVCPRCHGHGRAGPYRCPGCGGVGAIAGEYPLVVAFPAGVRSGYSVRLTESAGFDHPVIVRFLTRD